MSKQSKTIKDLSPKVVDFSFHSPHFLSHQGEQKLLMAGKHLLIGLIVSQDCECTVAERRGEELSRDSAVLIKIKDTNICAGRNQTAASSMPMKQPFPHSQLDAFIFPTVSH